MKVFPEGLFIFHSHWFLQHFIPKNMAKMPIFNGKEFVSPLHQHWHTPKLRVVFLSILWRSLPKDLFIFHSHWFLQNILFLQTWQKCLYLKVIRFFLHFSSTDIHQNVELYSSLYSEGFYLGICLYFIHTAFYNNLFLKTWRKCLYLKVKSFFLHFSSTDIHQNLELYSTLYYEGFPRGVCLYFIHTGFYNILFLKIWRKCLYLTVKSLFLPFISTDIHQNLELYSSLYSEGFHWGICLYFMYTDLNNILFVKNMVKMPILKVKSLFPHFSSTDIHQNL